LSIGELSGENTAGSHHAAIESDRFIDYREAVALTKVSVKIHVAAKNIGELDRDAVRDPCGVARSKKGRLDLARFHLDLPHQLDLLLERLETFANAVERQDRVPFGEVPERSQPAVLIDLGLHGGSGKQNAKRAIRSRGSLDRFRVPFSCAEPAQKAGRG